MITDREREEKEAKLTTRTRACSEEPKENRSGLIPPGTRGKEEDIVIAVVDPGSIQSAERYIMTRRSSTFHRSGS
jgi:hypothetical protein